MANEFDIIIIGGGPNGLQIGAYLSQAGQKVLLLERRFEVGGGLATEVVTIPGFFHNTHAIYHMMVDYAPVYQDFKLEEVYDVKHIHPELEWCMPLKDNRCLCIYQDVDKTCASIANFSKKDAESYRQMHQKYKEMMDNIVGPMTYIRPEPALAMAAKAEETALGKEIAALTEKSPEQVICELFEDDAVRTLMLYICCHWGLDYNQSGIGYLIPLYMNRATNYRLVAGGTHRVSNALIKSMYERKARVRQNADIKRIIVENGTAKGVELRNGMEFIAKKAVISTIDVHQTFLNYVGRENLEEDFLEMIDNYMWEKWSLCNLHLALDKPPQFKAAEQNPDINNAFIYLLGYENLDNLKNHWEAMRNGELPDTAGFNTCFPSVHDPYQAPPGRATCLVSQMAPFDLKDGGSDKWLNIKRKEEWTEKKIATLKEYIPDIKDKVVFTYVTTPADIQNKFLNMVKGSYKQGQYHPLQMGYLRPNQDCSQNVTPIKNLYLGGASVYPGGCVIWGPGYNCANTVAEEHGIEKWWNEPAIVTKARENGYI